MSSAGYNSRMNAFVGVRTAQTAANWVGKVIHGFPLRQYLGGHSGTAVFATESNGQKLAIKLIAADKNADEQLARITSIQKISHPHLLHIFEANRCEVDGGKMLYVVTEFADENLAQVIPARALSPQEATQMLAPVVDALGHLHRNSFVHGHLKPSNILVVNEQIKLSSEALYAAGEPLAKADASTRYAGPESLNSPASPANDVWAVGMILVEAVTQRAPVLTQPDPLVPATLPETLQEIARNCLRGDPQQRWTTKQIKGALNTASVGPETAQPVITSRKWIYGVGVALLLLVAILTFPKLLRHEDIEHTATPNPASTATSTSTPSQAPAVPPLAANLVAGTVLHQALPEVPKSALRTIHGIIKLRVRINVDDSGEVRKSRLEAAGPSKYFARLAVESARNWKFNPPQKNGAKVPSVWTLHYEFTRSGVRAKATQADTSG